MIENLIWLVAGIVVGVVYYAALQPRVATAWTWLKERIGIRRDAP